MASASTRSPLRGEGKWDTLSTSAFAGTAPLPTLSPEGRGLSVQHDGTPA